MTYPRVTVLCSVVMLIFLVTSCTKKGDFLLFSVQDDITMGAKMADHLANDPSFNILSRQNYSTAYRYIESMMDSILASEMISYPDEFPWKINIIEDNQTLNAFATPGGQLYVYTGLIYFLDKEDDLAGVIGHEIAHSDQRHSSKQLQRQYGISVLLDIIAGNETHILQQIVGQITGTIATLAFSRATEAEADEYSVKYLADTDYACNGSSFFFEKLLRNKTQRQPQFLNTHPSPDSRVENINAIATKIGCDTSVDINSENKYRAFRSSLP